MDIAMDSLTAPFMNGRGISPSTISGGSLCPYQLVCFLANTRSHSGTIPESLKKLKKETHRSGLLTEAQETTKIQVLKCLVLFFWLLVFVFIFLLTGKKTLPYWSHYSKMKEVPMVLNYPLSW